MSYQRPVPDHIKAMSQDDLNKKITSHKNQLQDQLVILGHHYQRHEVIKHADITGDSLKLARLGMQQDKAKHIIFCGVHFMAETADILATEDQKVYLPDLGAGCDMADMAEIREVEEIFNQAEAAGFSEIIPVTYVNSSAALKAFVGKKGGVICTSGNAEKVITWALENSRHLFFLPDQHLGRNTAKRLGLSPERDMILWEKNRELGGHSTQKLAEARVWLWQGHCPVHALFSTDQISKLRKNNPTIKIISHPECSMEVVDKSDFVGSTEFIIQTINASKKGSHWAVGTEKHLVERLQQENPDKKIESINPFTCVCGTMNRITLENLAMCLEEICNGKGVENIISVSQDVASNAKLALNRMMELS